MKKGIVIAAIAVLIACIASIAAYFILRQQREMSELLEQFDIQKQELEDEYMDLAIQYEGQQLSVNNDSLIQQLDNERVKVQRLLEELRTVKSTNALRINELKKELATLRTIMKGYIIQIDSLNSLNKQLVSENKAVKKRYEEVTQAASKLEQEKQHLTQQVTIASKLDALAIQVQPLDKRNKATSKISKLVKLRFDFLLGKNVTANPGERYIYLRIMKPDDDPLVKSRTNTFNYEDKEIEYSIRKMIEYTGEESPITLYWDVEEFLYPGSYRVDIFADGYLIGSKKFSLEK